MSNMPFQNKGDPLPDEARQRIFHFLEDILRQCDSTLPPVAAPESPSDQVAAELFRLLTNRKYCYLSKRRAERYRDKIVASFEKNMEQGEPLSFFYDIGGGYHACIHPDKDDLVFEVGLAELCVLSQISSFQHSVLEIYSPGSRFSLVIDNLCAHFVNDISVKSTERYCSMLRQLIAELRLDRVVDLVVESEHFPASEYQTEIDNTAMAPSLKMPTPAETQNVSRFLGRACSAREAAERIAIYETVTDVSESHLEQIVDGIRMTQRASERTISFRPFTGGDSRIQAGEVVLVENSKGKIKPLLLTSKNASAYTLYPITTPGSFPQSVRHINFAVSD